MAIINGTAGNDNGVFSAPFLLFGTPGDDTINGLAGNDTLLGNGGNDLLDGGIGVDVMQGGEGDDTYIVDNRGDQVSEGDVVGFDTVKSLISLFTLPDNVEKLILTGTGNINGIGNASTGANFIIGNDGNNDLQGNGGDDFLDGGKGTDSVVEVADSNFSLSNNSLSFTGGVDELVSIEKARLIGGESNNTINAASFSGDVLLVGAGGSDTLIGGSGNDSFFGDDFFSEAVNDDTILGGGGTDTVVGGTSTNFILTNISLKGQGNDTLLSIEEGDLTGNGSSNTIDASAFSGSVGAFGGNGDDVLLGAKGSDRLFGDDGSDIVAGGAGNDSLVGGFGGSSDGAQDKFVYNTGVAFKATDIGIDKIEDFAHNIDKIVLDKKTFTSISINTGSGFSQAGEFKVVTSDSAAKTSSADIVYNSANGKLFYNQNGFVK